MYYAQAKAAAEATAQQAREKEQQEVLNRQRGEAIDYLDFYAQVEGTGLPIGKRFRFWAFITDGLTLCEDQNYQKSIIMTDAAFDDEAQHAWLLKGPPGSMRWIVASMGENGRVQIHSVTSTP